MEPTLLDVQQAPLTILIIEENPDTVAILSGMLADKAEILTADNATAGIESAKKNRPELIMVGAGTDDYDGYAVCKELKSDPDTQQSSVLLLIGDDDASQLAVFEAGAEDFLARPFNPAVVRARVDTHLKLHRHANIMRKFVRQDGLTGLFDRIYFDKQCEVEFLRHRRQKLPLGIAVVASDECLRTSAHALSAATRRPAEVVARYGTDKFGIILPSCGQQDIKKYGAWICETIRGLGLSHPGAAGSPLVSISAGLVSAMPSIWGVFTHTIARANLALYRAQENGGNQFYISE
jgi:PleD family two-component response regulator